MYGKVADLANLVSVNWEGHHSFFACVVNKQLWGSAPSLPPKKFFFWRAHSVINKKMESTDAETLSAYEKERLANIARNERFLKSIGLATKEKIDVQKKRKMEQEVPSEPSRKSSRIANIQPEHGELPYEYCLAEVRHAIRRNRGKRTSHRSFMDLQAEEIERKKEATFQRKKAKQVTEDQKMRHLFDMQKEEALRAKTRYQVETDWNSDEHTMQSQVGNMWGGPLGRYPVQGPTAACPRCKGIFVLPKGGGFRKHRCIPVPFFNDDV